MNPDTVLLFDVDNTLLDNDRFKSDVAAFLRRELDTELAERYWEHYEELRREHAYADFIGAAERLRLDHPYDPRIHRLGLYLLNYPFHECDFPGALDVIEQLRSLGRPVIITDGDAVFQPWKIERSGLLEAFHGEVMFTVHKDQELDFVQRRFPAERYVIVDDKLSILTSVKEIWQGRVTTVWVRQGHYAAEQAGAYPDPDLVIDTIAELPSRVEEHLRERSMP
jgi:FMN phosphatase YigB (HAD superfamily)